MKKFLSVLLFAALAVSCDDGDIIVTDFEFEDQELRWCGTEDNQVFYKINNEGVNEAIALTLDFTRAGEDLLFDEEFPEGEAFPINDQNQVIYRTFSGEVSSDYFCNQIPPVNPTVAEEYRSTTGGTILITSTLINADDHDGDGVPTSVEKEVAADQTSEGFPDTDGDGYPNYLDTDDDNDNVLTEVEIDMEEVLTETTAEAYPDTDGDGIPNYIDPDDDGDGVISRNEDLNESMNPHDDVNDAGVPNYLNSEISDDFEFSELRVNSFPRGFRYTIVIQNLTLVRLGGDGEQIRMDDYVLGTFSSPQRAYTPGEDDEETADGNDGEEDDGSGEENTDGDGETEGL